MAADNLDTLRRFYAAEAAYLAAGGGDFTGIAATLDPEVVIRQPASLPYGGEWRGHPGFEAWMRAFAGQWAAMDVTGSELFPAGDVVVSRSHVHATHKPTGRAGGLAAAPILQISGRANPGAVAVLLGHGDAAVAAAAVGPSGTPVMFRGRRT